MGLEMHRKMAVLFAGQGQQFEGMGRDLAAADSRVALLYRQASDLLGYDLLGLDANQLKNTEFTQPALLTLSQGLWEILKDYGFAPTAVTGLSLGEYNALVACGVLGFSSCLELVQKRAKLMAGAMPEGASGMAAVLRVEAGEVVAMLSKFDGQVAVCNWNTRDQVVIGGLKAPLAEACELLKKECGAKVLPLSVSTVSHMSLLAEAGQALKKVLEGMDYRVPTMDFYSNVDGAVRTEDFVDSLTRQISHTTHMYQTICGILDSGVTVFVEIGPKGALSGMVRSIAKTLGCSEALTVVNIFDVPSLESALSVLGSLTEEI